MKSHTAITTLLTLLLLLFPNLLKSQVFATVFIDSVEIAINGELRYTSHQTQLKCVSRDMAIPIYHDGTYKLIFAPVPVMVYQNVINLYRNDTLLYLELISGEVDYKDCQDLYFYSYIFEYCAPGEQVPLRSEIKLYYRYTPFVPEDTAHYSLNYREGVWIGNVHKDAKAHIAYHEDQKHGPASVLTQDSLFYQAHFRNNFTDNYDEASITNLRNNSRYGGSYIIYDILGSCYSPQANTYPSFSFVKKHRSKHISKGDDLSVYYDKKGLAHDSISYNVQGEFLALLRDTMIIGVENLYVHDFYRLYTDSLHSFYVRKPEPFAKVPLKDITKIYKDRDVLTPAFLAAGLAFASALLIAPLVSLQKDGFNSDRYAKVSLSSLGVMITSITTGIVFSQKKYIINRNHKNRRTWKIRPEEYAY